MTAHTRLAIAADVLFANVDGEAVLLSHERALYFGLNDVGSHIWRLVGQQATLGEIQRSIVTTFGADPDTVWQDLVHVVNDLRRNGLVTTVAPQSPAVVGAFGVDDVGSPRTYHSPELTPFGDVADVTAMDGMGAIS